jgi:multidrug resistance efflux pump
MYPAAAKLTEKLEAEVATLRAQLATAHADVARLQESLDYERDVSANHAAVLTESLVEFRARALTAEAQLAEAHAALAAVAHTGTP